MNNKLYIFEKIYKKSYMYKKFLPVQESKVSLREIYINPLISLIIISTL